MPHTKAVLFDLGAVIINLDMPKTYHALSNLGINENIVLKEQELFLNYEIGAISSEQFLKTLLHYAFPQTSKQMLIDAWNAMLLDIPDERFEILLKLKEKYPLFLLSNTNELHIQAINQYLISNNRFELYHSIFEKIFYSHEIHLRKPNDNCFQWVAQQIGFNLNDIFFIDDNETNCLQAKTLGIQTYQALKPIDWEILNTINREIKGGFSI